MENSSRTRASGSSRLKRVSTAHQAADETTKSSLGLSAVCSEVDIAALLIGTTINPNTVLYILREEFKNYPGPENPSIQEKEVAKYIARLLRNDDVFVEEIQTLHFDPMLDSDEEEEIVDDEEPEPSTLIQRQVSEESKSSSSSGYKPSPKKRQQDLDDEYLHKAYMFWTKDGFAGLGNRRTWNCVQHNFRRLTSLQVLRNYEQRFKEGRTKKSNRLEKINDEVMEIFRCKVQENAVIHDRTIRNWALQVKMQIDPELDFKASQSWVDRFKVRNRIVSRAITHRVGRTAYAKSQQESLEKEAEEFVARVREDIINRSLAPSQVLNTDQSRFDKEVHSGRTLRFKGVKHVTGAVGSLSATRQSYCIMPIVTMEGKLLPLLYVLVSEQSGRFPHTKATDPPNIWSQAHTSANMMKKHLKSFLSRVFTPSVESEDKICLLVDSWSSFKDEITIRSHIPQSKDFKYYLCPAKCTGMKQPLDVYFFRPYKAFVKYITDSIIERSNFNIWHRDNFLKLQSLTHAQFSAPLFRSMIHYAWHKCGFVDEEPELFLSPMQYCFDTSITDTCNLCDDLSFFRCAHCTNAYCLDHTIILTLHLCHI